jgi:hypothetical protein
MSETMRVRVGQEMDVAAVGESEDGLVEVGSVSEATKGSLLGPFTDTSGSQFQYGPG